MTQLELSIIIPVFNKWELTAQCLKSLAEHTPGDAYEVIVVDNASSDETPALLPDLGKSLFGERFTHIRFEENRNFAGGCNAGAAAAKAPLLFFLNNDTLATPGWLPPLTRRLSSDPSLGMVGPLLLYPDERVQHLGVTFAPEGLSHLYRLFPKDHPVVRRPRPLQFLTAAALMVPKELFHAAGGFYEEYKNGFEDVELSIRVRGLGKTLACVPESVIYHLESQSPGRSDAETHNSALLLNRCGKYFYIDTHQHAQADGFAVTWEPGQGFIVHVTPEEDARLRQEAASLSAADILKLLRQNPLWRGGYDFLATALEKSGHFEPALSLRLEAAGFFAGMPEWRAALRSATKSNNARLAQEMEGAIQKRLIRSRDKNRLEMFLRMAERNNDEFLAELLRADLENMRQG